MTNETKLSYEQLEDRLAALHRASLELVQDVTFDTLLERIVRIACEQVGATFGAIGVEDEMGHTTRFITVGINHDNREKTGHQPQGRSLISEVTEVKAPLRIDYIQKDPLSEGLPNNHPVMTSLLSVPIRSGDEHLGQVYLTDKDNNEPFTKNDERVIEMLAAYAAVAITNARSYDKLHHRDRTLTRRNEDLALINNLASTLASTSDVDQLLNTALERVMTYFTANVGEVYLGDDGHHIFEKVLHQGKSPRPIWTQDRISLNEGLIGKTAKSGKPILVNLPFIDDPFLRNEALLEENTHQIACFPLASRSEISGVLCIGLTQEKLLEPMDQQLLSSIASWIGISIENVNLNIQGRRLAVLEERERIGMDLHDGVIQSIYAVGLSLEHARLLLGEEPELTRQLINQSIEDLNSTIRDLRAFIMDMRPRQLFEEDLMDGLQRLVNEFRANSLIEAKLSGPKEGLEDLPDSHAIALFHICQEALANVAKHAGAKSVKILVWTTQDRVLMEIHDDGQGFDLQQIQLALGHGISNMQTRARNVGGDLEISSAPGEGTSIMVWVPSVANEQAGKVEKP